MPSIKILTGRSAATLDKYLETEKEDSSEERVMFAATRHCQRETAVAEFKATREMHGTDGAKRQAKASHVAVDPATGCTADGEVGTHVRHWDGMRYRMRPVRDGETATHLRIEGDGSGKESEVTHTIVAFGLDEVNPQDPEQCRLAFEGFVAQRELDYPGLQEKLIGQRDSGKFHVHVMSSSTIYADMSVGDRDFVAGQKMAGDLTDIHDLRDRCNRFFTKHPAYGVVLSKALHDVGTPEYEAVQIRSAQRDYWSHTRSKESNHDRIRRVSYEALRTSGGREDTWMIGSASGGLEVKEVGLRRGTPTSRHDYSYRLKDTNSWVRGATLGPAFTHAAVTSQLKRVANGLEVEQPAAKNKVGPERPVTPISSEELTELQQRVDDLAAAEQERQAAEQSARATGEVGRDGAQVVVEPVHMDVAPTPEGRVAELARIEAAQLEAEYDRLRLEHPDEWVALRGELAADASPLAGADFREALVDAQLSSLNAGGQLEARLKQIREQANRPDQAANIEQADSQSVADEDGVERPAEVEPTEEAVELTPGSRGAPTTPKKPRAIRQVGLLSGDQRKDAELIAVRHGQATDGSIVVDFQLAAHDPAAKDRPGLHLMVRKTQRVAEDGTTTEVGVPRQKVTPEQWTKLQQAAGDNRVEIAGGREVLAFRGDIAMRGDGRSHTVRVDSAKPSTTQIDNDVLARQRASEDRAREKEVERLRDRLEQAKEQVKETNDKTRDRGQSQGDGMSM